ERLAAPTSDAAWPQWALPVSSRALSVARQRVAPLSALSALLCGLGITWAFPVRPAACCQAFAVAFAPRGRDLRAEPVGSHARKLVPRCAEWGAQARRVYARTAASPWGASVRARPPACRKPPSGTRARRASRRPGAAGPAPRRWRNVASTAEGQPGAG